MLAIVLTKLLPHSPTMPERHVWETLTEVSFKDVRFP